jgi:sarcosine oxidase delta subunit
LGLAFRSRSVKTVKGCLPDQELSPHQNGLHHIADEIVKRLRAFEGANEYGWQSAAECAADFTETAAAEPDVEFNRFVFRAYPNLTGAAEDHWVHTGVKACIGFVRVADEKYRNLQSFICMHMPAKEAFMRGAALIKSQVIPVYG